MKHLKNNWTCLLVGLCSVAFGQTSVDPNAHVEKPRSDFYAPARAKGSGYKKPKVTHTAQYEFYKRVEHAARDKQRMLKRLSKPQFSNPAYFGHKHKPKKRPPRKMRLCSECMIRH